MPARRALLAWILAAAGLLGAPAPGGPPSPPSERRVALVIGNAAYATAPLANPLFDARDMAEALRRCGFSVTKLENATRDQMALALRDFGDRLLEGGAGLFYFAGHGLQVRGKNYLVPVNADIQREDEVPFLALDAEAVLAKMESARNRVNIVILDACRNDPFGRSFRSSARGLAQMDAPRGTYIAFATAPGRTASDGQGRNGLYTRHILQNLATPGLKVEDVFKRVRAGVLKESAEQQMPWDSSSLVGDFWFLPPTPAAPTATGADRELAFWNTAVASGHRADLEAYLAQYPEGTFAALARTRLAESAHARPDIATPSRGHLGAVVLDVPEGLRQALKARRGALVTEVVPDSPAAHAGLQVLDVVIQVGTRPVGSAVELRTAVEGGRVGDRVPLTVLREGALVGVPAWLGRPTPDPPKPVPSTPTDERDPFKAFFGGRSAYGLRVEDSTPALRAQHALPSDLPGAVVAWVDPAGSARDHLQPGDVVTAVLLPEGLQPVGSLPDYLRALGRAKQGTLYLRIRRPAARRDFLLPLPFAAPQP